MNTPSLIFLVLAAAEMGLAFGWHWRGDYNRERNELLWAICFLLLSIGIKATN